MPIISENSTSATRALIRAFLKMNATSGARDASFDSAAGAVTSRPVKLFQLRAGQQAGGRKISTMIRIEKAATSLYSTEKYADHSVSIRPIKRRPASRRAASRCREAPRR